MKYTVCFIFSKCRRKVCLILKEKPNWQKGRYNGIGGKQEKGETTEETCIREVKEEIGLDIQLTSANAVCNILVADGQDTRVFFFRYFLLSHQLPHQCEQETIQWFDVNNLPPNMIVNLNWLIPMALIDDENIYEIEEIFTR